MIRGKQCRECLRQSVRRGILRIWQVLPETLLVSCLVVIAADYRLLDRIQNVTLGFAAVTFDRFGDTSSPKSTDAGVTPPELFTLEIDQRAYEGIFNQQSPLDRRYLCQLLRTISNTRDEEGTGLGVPGVIAIDLDLSPNPTGGDVASSVDCDLTATLKNIATQIPVVLLLPQPVATEGAIEAKLDWVNELSGVDNLYFGLASLIVEDGSVLHYLDTPASFAHAICRAVRSQDAKVSCRYSASAWPAEINRSGDPTGAVCAHLQAEGGADRERLITLLPYQNGKVCCAAEPDSFAPLLDRYVMSLALADGPSRYLGNYLATLNFTLFKALEMPILRLAGSSEDQNIQLTLNGRDVASLSETNAGDKPLDGQLLMIGSRYGVTDMFHMMGREVPGSLVHLAAYLSIRKPVSDLAPLLGLMLDLLIGLPIAVLLVWLKECYFQSPNVVLLGTNLVAPFASIAVFSLIGYGLLMSLGVLTHPGPIVAGVMIGIYFERLDKTGRGDSANTARDPSSKACCIRIWSFCDVMESMIARGRSWLSGFSRKWMVSAGQSRIFLSTPARALARHYKGSRFHRLPFLWRLNWIVSKAVYWGTVVYAVLLTI